MRDFLKSVYFTPKWLYFKIAALKCKAKRLGVPFNLDEEYLLKLLHDSKGKCKRTGCPFATMSFEENRQTWLSIDRIDPKGGYVKGNIDLVIIGYNMGKVNATSAATNKMFKKAAAYMNRKRP